MEITYLVISYHNHTQGHMFQNKDRGRDNGAVQALTVLHHRHNFRILGQY